jgi:hypothetical protein
MKCIFDKRVTIPLLLFMLTFLAGCVPATPEAPKQELPPAPPTVTETALTLTETFSSTASPTASETRQPTQTYTPTASETARPEIFTSLPLLTTAKPARTRKTLPIRPTDTAEPTQTFTPTASETEQPIQTLTPIVATCPPATPEILSVEPVTSPTDQFTQIIIVHIGFGEEVTVVTESGTFSVTGDFGVYANPASVEITLLPNTEHHLEVFAKVRHVPSSNGCIYGGYTLRTTRDGHGAPLAIVQGTPTP